MKIKDVLVMAAIGLLGAACSDDDNKGSQWGDGVGGTKTNLDVSAYDKWTYVNLKTGETEIHPDTSEWIYTDGSVSEPKAKETIGIEWHIAIHRYEIKTNGGMVFDTEKTNMNEITELPEGDYKADENITNEDEAACDHHRYEQNDARQRRLRQDCNCKQSVVQLGEKDGDR